LSLDFFLGARSFVLEQEYFFGYRDIFLGTMFFFGTRFLTVTQESILNTRILFLQYEKQVLFGEKRSCGKKNIVLTLHQENIFLASETISAYLIKFKAFVNFYSSRF